MCTPLTGSMTKLKPLGFLRSLSSDVLDHLRDQEARRLGRHSKSLDTEGKVCGCCHSRFQLLTSGKVTSQTPMPHTASPLAVFVKEKYCSVKSGGGLHHKNTSWRLSVPSLPRPGSTILECFYHHIVGYTCPFTAHEFFIHGH